MNSDDLTNKWDSTTNSTSSNELEWLKELIKRNNEVDKIERLNNEFKELKWPDEIIKRNNEVNEIGRLNKEFKELKRLPTTQRLSS